MADISVTAANVVKSSGTTESGTAGEAITAGQTVYKKTSDSKFWLADADATAVSGNSEIDEVYGVALNGAAASQPLTVQKSGIITIGGTVAVGTVYVQSATAGGIAPITDLVATDYVTLVGVGMTTGTLDIDIIKSTGVQVPA